jgi:hypothetical protein
LPAGTEEKFNEDAPVTEIFANAKVGFANYSCDLVLDRSLPDYNDRRAGCLAAAAYLVKLSSPTQIGGEQASFPSLIKKVLNEPVYTKAMAIMATKLIAKLDPVLKNPTYFETHPKDFGDFYDDMVDSFAQADPHASQAQNIDRAFDIMALYGTRGAGFSFIVYLSQKENLSLSPSLNIIATALNILNRASLGSEKLYAFPSFVQSTCADGRPYHFWMAAYLTRESAKTGQFKSLDIFAAVHALRVAYKLIGPSSVWQTYFIAPLKFGYTRELQKDLIFGALGSYGILKSADLDFSKSLDGVPVDNLLLSQMNSSNFSDRPKASILDNLPSFLKYFATKEFDGEVDGKVQSRLDRQWSAGLAPNSGFRNLYKMLEQ